MIKRKNFKIKNYKILYLMVIFLFINTKLLSTQTFNQFINHVFDFENIKKVKYIETKYLIEGSSKSATETVNYYINLNSENNFIDVVENAYGSFCNSFYETSFTKNLLNGFTKATYFSEPENKNYKEEYIYSNYTLYYKEYYKNKSKTYNLDSFSGDSIRLMEMLTFAKLNYLKNIKAIGFIVPGALKIPFIFKFIKEENIILNGKNYECLLFSGEINGFLNAPAKLLFGTSKIWVLKKYPHIRIKAYYFNKTFSIIDYNIIYRK